MIINGKELIKDFKDWQNFFIKNPRHESKWTIDQSDYQLANEFTTNNYYHLRSLFKYSMDFYSMELDTCFIKVKTKIDQYVTTKFEHDLIIEGTNKEKKVVMSYQALVDSTFGNTIQQEMSKINKKREVGIQTSQHLRVKQLLTELFGFKYKGDFIPENYGSLKYTLLQLVAATLIEANKNNAEQGMIVFHQFITPNMNILKHEKNVNDFNQFIELFTHLEYSEIEDHQIIGPIIINSEVFNPKNIPLYIGKLNTFL